MGKNNQQRRAAKAKDRRRRAQTPPERGSGPPQNPFGWDPRLLEPTPEELRAAAAADLLSVLAEAAAVAPAGQLPHLLRRQLAEHDSAVRAEAERMVVGELTSRLAAAWEHGWQPQDLQHGASKRGSRTEGLTASLITEQARMIGAGRRAPYAWREQLQLVAERATPSPPGGWHPVRLLQTDGVAEAEAWAEVLGLVKILAELPPLAVLLPPPSTWGRDAATDVRSDSSDRDRVLNRIRALLAKAEATDHPAEAETFTAKAQELMTRHAVDEALLRAGAEETIEVVTRRVHLQSPYAAVKVLLVNAVAGANRALTIYLESFGIASMVGTPVDLEQVELLFTSLLIQATRAMAAAGKARAGSFDRSATFRRSFLTAYAHRIGQRLTEADRSTTESYGAELVPLLHRQASAVDAEFERQFPHTRNLNAGYIDPRGWRAGLAAADEAVFVAGRLPTT
ncbi:MAG: DUF2786 domain-containing protein [Propionibacteriaceae bacterium]